MRRVQMKAKPVTKRRVIGCKLPSLGSIASLLFLFGITPYPTQAGWFVEEGTGLNFTPDQVGIGFVPTPGEPQPDNVDLQTALDIQTNTFVTAGDGVRVNLAPGEPVAGFSLMRGGEGIGGLLLQPSNDVLLTSDQSLRLEALNGIVYSLNQVGIGFVPTPGQPQPENVDLQTARDIQTNTNVTAGDGVRVNLDATEDVRGFSLMRSGEGIGGLLLQPSNDILLSADNNLRLEAVNGSVYVNKLVVEASGADFVFAKGYRLRPLSEVEQHITMYGSLPDMPSSGDMEANGLALGDMQTKLLQKIEELTLYIIAQNKRLDIQEKQLKKQARKLAQLQSAR